MDASNTVDHHQNSNAKQAEIHKRPNKPAPRK